MKKIFLFLSVALVSLAMQATEHTVWSGNQPISWNQANYAGITFEVYNLHGLAAGDVIKVYGTPMIEAANVQYALKYKAGGNWTWTDLSTTVKDNVVSYVVANATIASEIAERGLIITGQGYKVTKVTIATANGQKEVWHQKGLHIYYTDETHNYNFYSRDSAVDLSSLRPGYKIKVYTEDPAENPGYRLQYKAGDGWDEWTEIATSADANGVISYEIPSVEMAQTLTARGIIVNGGDGYYFNRIGVESAPTYTLWEGTTTPDEENHWWWLNGQGYLVSDVSMLATGDKLILTISETDGSDRQLRITNQETEGETPTFGNIYVTTLDNEGAQTVEVTLTEANVTALKSGKGGIIAQGTGCTLTKIELQKASQSAEERTVWLNRGKQISWNNAYYPGDKFDTHGDMTLSVAAGSIIRAQITVGLSSYSYNVQYKTGSDWTWTNLIAQVDASGTVGSTTEISYTVADAEHAALIAERGLVFKGQGYNIDRIIIEVPSSDLTIFDADPSASLTRLKSMAEPVDITINRTLYRDGYFNTLCLPFDISAAQITETDLAGAEIMAFTNAYISGTGDARTLDLRFTPVSSMEAGMPYLVRFPNTGDQLNSLTFSGVTITKDPSDEETVVEGNSMNFVGILAPEHLNSTNNLFLGDNDVLYWMHSGDETYLQGFRAYFTCDAGEQVSVPARIVTRGNIVTDIEEIPATQTQSQKLMRNGQLFIIRDGKIYNVLGQTINE